MDPAGEADGSLTQRFATGGGDLTYAELADAIAKARRFQVAISRFEDDFAGTSSAIA